MCAHESLWKGGLKKRKKKKMCVSVSVALYLALRGDQTFPVNIVIVGTCRVLATFVLRTVALIRIAKEAKAALRVAEVTVGGWVRWNTAAFTYTLQTMERPHKGRDTNTGVYACVCRGGRKRKEEGW